LDGIRALAVLAVIGYHLGYTWLPGGFLGVDVFFVLSGFLITGLLVDEYAATGRINLGAFWLRRARRLLPALFVVVAAVAIWIPANASPFELGLRRADLLWTLFYGSNWHFIASGEDYFAQFTTASPVQHTWSLAIEEQFYLLWPLLVGLTLWLGRRWAGSMSAVCAIGIVGSVALMAALYDKGDPGRSYFGTDARIHQLLIGALLSIAVRQRSRHMFPRAPWVAAFAAGWLTVAVALVSDHAPAYYYGLSGLVAVVAAALIWGLERAPSGLLARALSLRPIAWTGRISYGLYLWHWPAILAITVVPEPFASVQAGLDLVRVGVTFALATASFYLLEEPIRTGRMPLLRRSARRFILAAVSSAALLVGTSVWATSAPVPELAGLPEIPGCNQDEVCLRNSGPDGGPVVALVGDSIARSLDPAFQQLAIGHGWTYLLLAPNGCRLTELLTSYNGSARPRDRACVDLVPRLQKELLSRWKPNLIVAIDRWEISDAVGPDGNVLNGGTPEHVTLVQTAVEATARRLTAGGSKLVFIELPPLLPAACMKPSPPASTKCSRNVSDDGTHAPYNAMFRNVASIIGNRVATISVTNVICPAGICVPEVDGRLIRFDGLHFTPPAARWLAAAIYRDLAAARFLP
jgi:peptidoglycan/LPS O-acetylase OafA/YrhL